MRMAFLITGALFILCVSAACHPTGAVEVETPEQPLVTVDTEEPPPPPDPPEATPPTVNATRPEIPEGVVQLDPHCTRGVPDRPNALDDNCNGQVDESEVQSGSIQITLGWEQPSRWLALNQPNGSQFHIRTGSNGQGGRPPDPPATDHSSFAKAGSQANSDGTCSACPNPGQLPPTAATAIAPTKFSGR